MSSSSSSLPDLVPSEQSAADGHGKKFSQPTVQEIFDVLKSGPQEGVPLFNEDALKGDKIERKTNAIFVPTSIQRQFNALPKGVRDTYKWYGEQYYSPTIDAITDSVEKHANDSLLAVRAGYPIEDLTDDELVVLRNQYGEKWYLYADLTEEYAKECLEKRK